MLRSVALASALLPLAFRVVSGEPAPITTGVLSLLEVGNCRVGYHYEGGDVIWLPVGWVGHFEDRTGVSYQPWGDQDGRPALLMHCPWRGGHGRTFAEYDLRLPDEAPIRLVFATAMWRGHTQESDGVTYRAWLTSGRMRRDLLEQHTTATQWRDFEFDLSPLAGQAITLHLEVDDGPNGDASFDYSLWGDPRIVSGEGEPSLRERLDTLKALRAEWDAAPPDLLKLSNQRDAGCRPNVGAAFTNRTFERADAFVLEYQGTDCTIQYRIPKETADLAEATGQVDNLPAFRCCEGAGATLARGNTTFPRTVPEYSRELLSAALDGNALRIQTRLRAGDITVELRETVTISGKSLVISADSDDPFVLRYCIGNLGAVPFQRLVKVPYLYATDVRYLPDKALYCSWLLDWIDTGATYHREHEAVYDHLTDASRKPLHSVGYVTVSPYFAEVLPNTPLPASPFFDALRSRIVLDIWGGSYAEDAEVLQTLKSYGADNVAIIKHVWQNAGYDNALPAVLPANEGLGGDEAMKQYAAVARKLGYLFSVHENYVDYYPNFSGYTEEEVMRAADGGLVKAWYNAGIDIQSFALKPTAVMRYAREYSPEIHRRYGTTAAYLDVHTCVPPWFRVEARAAEPGAGKCRTNFDVYSELFAFERETHGGPLFGEGSRQMFWAGLVDGVEAQVDGGENAPLLVDFDLLKIHPQMVNHGMGYYERWLRWGYESVWGRDFPTGELTDKYRSAQIAFGHAGFMGSQLFRLPELTSREHHLVGPLQERYVPSRPVEILYEVAGEMVPASLAIALETLDRVYVRYENGLEVWCNWRQEDWNVRGRAIPQYCFLALGEDVEAWTREIDGIFVDYCETPDTIFADARPGGGIPEGVQPRDIGVELADFQDLGERTMRLTYLWRSGEAPEDDYRAFVHFTSEESEHPDKIVFQQDHDPTVPTRQWREGDEIADGPFELAVPPDIPAGEYDLRIGLYNADKRLRLKGYDDGSGRIILGMLTIGEDDSLTWRPAEIPPEAQRAADSHPGNADHRLIDFGKIVTNGAVLVKLGPDRLELTPTWRQGRFEVSLDLTKIKSEWAEKSMVLTIVDAQGKELQRRTVTPDRGLLSLTTHRRAAAMRLTPEQ